MMLPTARVPSRRLTGLRPVVLLVGSAALSGATMGLLLSQLAAQMPHRLWIASVVSASVVFGFRCAIGRRPFQFDQETPRHWLRFDDSRRPLFNGLALGCGVASRIRFWSLYAIIVVAYTNSTIVATVVYAMYGLVRLLSSVLLRLYVSAPGTAFLRIAPCAARIDRVGAPLLFTLIAGESMNVW